VVHKCVEQFGQISNHWWSDSEICNWENCFFGNPVRVVHPQCEWVHPQWGLSQFSEDQVSPSAGGSPAVRVGSPALRTWVIFCSSNTKKSEPSADALGLSAGGLTRTGDLVDFLRSSVLGPVRVAHPQCGWVQTHPGLSKAVIWTRLNPVRVEHPQCGWTHPHSRRKMCNAIYRWVPKAQDNQLF